MGCIDIHLKQLNKEVIHVNKRSYCYTEW
jgi:hypothetical protein